MNQDRLALLIKRPEIQRQILNGYVGAFAIGLTLNPTNRRELAIRVQVEGSNSAHIPAQVLLEGERVPIVVNTGFQAPEPLRRRA